MKASTGWNYAHYIPLHETERAAAPYICCIAPMSTGFSFKYMDMDRKTTYIA